MMEEKERKTTLKFFIQDFPILITMIILLLPSLRVRGGQETPHFYKRLVFNSSDLETEETAGIIVFSSSSSSFFFFFFRLLSSFIPHSPTSGQNYTNLFTAGRNDPCRLFLASESSKKRDSSQLDAAESAKE